MQKSLLVLSLVLAALCCGCASAPQASSSVPESSATPETTITTTPAPAESSTLSLEPTDYAVLKYDEIRAIRRDAAPYWEQMSGYYTMSQNGKWGLMRTDGTEVLACQSSVPLTGCASADLRWHSSLEWEQLDALTAQLQTAGDGRMCSAEHDGSSHYWYYDTTTHKVQVDGGLFGGTVHDLEDYDAQFGAYLPCRLGTFVDGQGDPDYYRVTEPITIVYADGDGTLLNDQTYEAGGCFYDQPLAPACQAGKWLYLDLSGQAVTEAVYDATYGDEYGYYASPLLNGYAPVCREGRWGLLDSTGTEVLPCTYAGVAWDGGLLWLQQDDGWHAYTISGVAAPTPAPDPLAGLPANITPPDIQYTEQAVVQFRTIASDNVVLRAGPGTEYDRVGTLPPDTMVKALGGNESISNWTFVCYQDQFGWACTDYMFLTNSTS